MRLEDLDDEDLRLAFYDKRPVGDFGSNAELEIFNRLRSKNAMYFKDKYFLIENMLTEIFTVLPPVESYAQIRSPRCSMINREACILFENIMKFSCQQMDVSTRGLNICEFSKLLTKLKMQGFWIEAFGLYDDFIHYVEIGAPFFQCDLFLVKNSRGENGHPGWSWWDAYNISKHETGDISTEATFAQAISALSAVFALLVRKYGFGLVCRATVNPKDGTIIEGRSSKLFDVSEASTKVFFGEVTEESGMS